MKIIICTRDLDYGVGSVVKLELKDMDKNKKIKKVIVIGPRKLKGYSSKIHFEILPTFGKFFITKEPYFAFKSNLKIKELLKKEKIDEIYTHFPFKAEKFEQKFIAKFHLLHKSIIKNYPGTFLLIVASFFHKIYSFFDFLTIKYADEVLFVNKGLMEEAKKLYPKYTSKFKYSKNRIDNSKFFSVSKTKRRKLKKELFLDDGKKNILYVGRLEPMKGILDLLRVIEEINNLNIRLVIIGDGPLKERVVEYSFVDYRGKISNDEIYKYYNAVDLFIVPSHYETGPLTLLEAKECGCNTLSNDVGISRDILKKEEIYCSNEELKRKILKNFKQS